VTDLKRVIAYSTMSQIGYMIMAVSIRGPTRPACVAHLMTHAFFKALLFMSGRVGDRAHAGEQNMDRRRWAAPSATMAVTTFVMSRALALAAQSVGPCSARPPSPRSPTLRLMNSQPLKQRVRPSGENRPARVGPIETAMIHVADLLRHRRE